MRTGVNGAAAEGRRDMVVRAALIIGTVGAFGAALATGAGLVAPVRPVRCWR